MASRLKQPCAGCVPCYAGYGNDPCIAPITVGAATCVSRTGTAVLYGHCKFINATTGDLNGRRYRTRSLGSQWCADHGGCSSSARAWADWDVVYSVNDSGTCTVSGSRVGIFSCTVGASCYSGGASELPLCGQGLSTLDVACSSFSISETSAICTGDLSGYTRARDYYDLLTNPDTVDAGMQRASASVGSSCRTGYTSSTNGTCSNGYGGSTSVTGTSVVASIPLSNMSIGCTYTVSIELDRYTHAGSFVDTIFASVTFTAAATSDTLEYHVPITSAHAYEYVTATQA